MIKNYLDELLNSIKIGKVVRVCCEDGIDIRIKIVDASVFENIVIDDKSASSYLQVEANVEVHQKGMLIFQDVISCNLSDKEWNLLANDDFCLLTQEDGEQCEMMMKYTMEDIIFDDICLKTLEQIEDELGLHIDICKCAYNILTTRT